MATTPCWRSKALAGVSGEPVKQEEMMLHVGGDATLAGVHENLRGLSPGEERIRRNLSGGLRAIKLAGKTVRFKAMVKGLRKKELPLN